MAEHAHSAHQAPPHAVNAAMAVCLALVAVAIVVLVVRAPELPDVSEQSFALTAPQVDPERLAADRARHYPQADASAAAPEIEQLHATMRKANEAQFGTADGKAVHDLQIETLHHANAVITEVGIETFVPIGEPMFKACADAFGQLMEAVRTGKLTLEEASTDPGDAFAEYRRNCGNGFGPLLRSGVVTESGVWSDPVSGPLVFDIMNRFRWASTLDLRRPAWEQLTRYEYEILTRWRAAITTVPVRKRIEWVVAASKALPDTTRHELIGSLLFEDGDAVGALGAFEEACQADRTDLLLQRKCEFLRERVGSSAPVRPVSPH